MIFVILGTQKFQFNRLLEEVDSLIEKGIIQDKVFAQVGYSTYIPKHFDFAKFLNQIEFEDKIKKSLFVITHGGVGTIQTSLKYKKKIIAFPRLSKFKEHIDDHQIQICTKFSELHYLLSVDDVNSLEECIKQLDTFVGAVPNPSSKKILEKKIIQFIDEN